MCGICGEITFDGSPAMLDGIQRMMDRLAPRGPDGAGAVARGRAAVGQRRLKIIDLSDRAEQPMVDTELGLTISFNGCIYNYRELRAELEAKGYRFFSDGDTEVVLKAHAEWGPSSVERLQGMFAYSIFERDSGRLVLARDRLGIKPLYLAEIDGGKRLRFASTLPALLASGGIDTSVDPEGLHLYMSLHAIVPPPRTILKGVRKLPPATVSVFERDGRRKDHNYWQVSYPEPAAAEQASVGEWRERLLDGLRVAVKRRMVSDVPVGVLLSGGVDSSLVVGLLAESGQSDLKTFSVGFEGVKGERGDEFEYSDLIAKYFDTDHHKTFVESERMLEALPRTIGAMSEPMVSHDNVGFYLLSEQVSQQVKVVQSGQGADEILGGYDWYPPMMQSDDAVGDYAKVFFDRDHDEMTAALNPDFLSGDVSRAFVEEHFARPGATLPIDKALRIDSTVMLVDDPVKRVDNMTMAWGLEARVPFLDHELVELAAQIPPDHKIRDGGKGILKDVAREIIPEAVIDRPKGYFPVPALKYIEGPVLEFVHDALSAERARDRGLFREDYLDSLLADPAQHITPLKGSKLWQVALLEMWLQANNI
ncbi:MAG: N-acetylglutaminylglutamine amidotransferase [Rhodospirillales bacterium]